ncbi:MAG: replicative DNA helicase [Erysipelotrichaceae bacterium]|nr:replicative DNA helicase [Erysipelotrichaceae bacterium]
MAKQMPNAAEAEQSLLGNMLLYPSASRIAVESGLMEEDFYLDTHRRIFSALQELYNTGKPIDITTATAKLEDRQQLALSGGIDYLMQLSDAAVASANTKMYTEIIKDKARLRKVIDTAQKIADSGFEAIEDLDAYMDEAERSIINAARNRNSSEFRNTADVINIVIENIHKNAENKSDVTGVRTGYHDLDQVTHGLQRSDLIIMAARPGLGKTAVAINLAMNVALINRDQAVAIFSLEMPAEQLIMRLLSAKSHVKADVLKTGNLTSTEWGQLSEAATELKAAKLFIDDTPGLKTSDIFASCRKLASEHGIACVMIDYIQLLSASGKPSENRQQEVSEISRNLKALARELNVPVIALSQLSRTVEQRTDKHPMLSDLRESGALEQDADIVIMLYRDAYYNEEARVKAQEQGTEPIELNIAKHRNGATRTVNLAFEGATNAIYNMASE